MKNEGTGKNKHIGLMQGRMLMHEIVDILIDNDLKPEFFYNLALERNSRPLRPDIKERIEYLYNKRKHT